MQFLDVIDPPIHLLGVAVRVLNRMHQSRLFLAALTSSTQLQVKHGGVTLAGRGLIHTSYTQPIGFGVRARNLGWFCCGFCYAIGRLGMYGRWRRREDNQHYNHTSALVPGINHYITALPYRRSLFLLVWGCTQE